MNTQTQPTEKGASPSHALANAAIENPPTKKTKTKLFAWIEDAAEGTGTLVEADSYSDLRTVISDHCNGEEKTVRAIFRGRNIPFAVKTELKFWKA